MSRARRLAEIAKANEPVFSGAHWWLADPSGKSDPPPTAAPPEPSQAPEPVPAAVAVPATAAVIPAVEPPLTIVEARIARPVEPMSVPIMATSPLNLSGHASAPELEQESADTVRRISGLKERFLWLGRKSRAAQSQ